MQRHRVCAVGEMAPGDARKLDLSPPVAVFLTESGYFSTDDTCSHAQASLSEGFVEDDAVECPVHMARFCLRSGRPLSPPATKPVTIHSVVVEAGEVFVEIDR